MCRRQAPPPSHVPSRPQVEAASAGQADGWRGLAPVGRLTHIPGESVDAHVLHPSVHAVVQHTPSAQNPLAHSFGHMHLSPASFFVVTAGQVLVSI